MASAVEQSSYSSRRHDEPEFNLREWGLKARISRENTTSRRYSASYIRSFREDARSFRSNITISSTASSPGYSLKDEIDPSTYSFTTALKALQARTVCSGWECLSPDGFALNSKWNEAEKYICNPLSGEVPMECLSAKTLSGRSFRNLTNRITMSAPLVYSHSCHIQTNPSRTVPEDVAQFPTPVLVHLIAEKKAESMTRDVGTQSTPPDLSSGSLSPASTPSILERALKRCGTENGDSPNTNTKPRAEEQVEVKETGEREETIIDKAERRRKDELMCRCSRQPGCLSWMRRRQREKHKSRKRSIFFPHFKGC
ncbi:PREDICTED: uncharacterized protein LOC18602087 isoform X1 [Theobroma cacao]|uniref:Uncharacterized protein LOC18602087 isoform X1 n=1 Tax=Theobroma cacao TaxID=3641 RepID=A0AB32W7S7_THECC|nr:PREDICTED: uncharacterized protein LOC18602087 isoform X1 [Theobroma cacao]